MRTLIIMLLCWACASHGQKARGMTAIFEQNELETLARLLKAFDPAVGWQGAAAQLGQKRVQAPLARHSRTPTPRMDYVLNNIKIANPLQPVGNYVLVKLSGYSDKSSGGVLISEESAVETMPLDGQVVAAGPGKVLKKTGELVPCPCKVGDLVILPQAGGEIVEYEGAKHLLLDADAVLGIFEGGEKTVASIRVLQDRVMFQLPEAQTQTTSGVLIAGSLSGDDDGGEVIAVGSGTMSSEGEMMVPLVKVGETVVCEPDVGDEVTIEGKTLKFVFEQECLAKW
mmetsp:Transcript_157760/g.287428  ORF Transcript_157760/g.287428 Transcript_157760/m.287428 type:complete len:284 (+) Transcript_157760:57-908(+)